MKINELQAKQGSVNIELTVVDKEQPREFSKFGKPGRVCSAKAKDDTGEIKISLWNDQIDMVNAGDKIKIENGYVNEWQGELQLTTGRFGKIEVIGKSDDAGENLETTDDDQSEEPGLDSEEAEGDAVDEDVEEEKIE